MKTTDLYDDRVRTITTQGLNAAGASVTCAWTRVWQKKTRSFTGYVRLELDRVMAKQRRRRRPLYGPLRFTMEN